MPSILCFRITLPTYVALPIVFLISAVPVRVEAQQNNADTSAVDAEAREEFSLGREAYASGQFTVALTHFNRAYELSGRDELLYNIALVEDRLRLDDAALQHYQEYLEKVPDAPAAASVETRIRILTENQARDEALLDEAVRRAQLSAFDETAPDIDTVPQEQARRSVVRNPWFWVGIGGAVLAASVVTAIVLTQDSTTADPSQGTDGSTFFALSAQR
ncbi:MAG: hypothetical protein AAF550_05585 [Myxococcota bacterium]